MMMDDSAPTHERKKLVKAYKNVFPQKHTAVAKVCGETYSKKKKKKINIMIMLLIYDNMVILDMKMWVLTRSTQLCL